MKSLLGSSLALSNRFDIKGLRTWPPCYSCLAQNLRRFRHRNLSVLGRFSRAELQSEQCFLRTEVAEDKGTHSGVDFYDSMLSLECQAMQSSESLRLFQNLPP